MGKFLCKLCNYTYPLLFYNRFTDAWEWKKWIYEKTEVGLRPSRRSPPGQESKSEKITFCTGTMWACCNNSINLSRVCTVPGAFRCDKRYRCKRTRLGIPLLFLCSRPTIGLYPFFTRTFEIRVMPPLSLSTRKTFANYPQSLKTSYLDFELTWNLTWNVANEEKLSRSRRGQNKSCLKRKEIFPYP